MLSNNDLSTLHSYDAITDQENEDLLQKYETTQIIKSHSISSHQNILVYRIVQMNNPLEVQ